MPTFPGRDSTSALSKTALFADVLQHRTVARPCAFKYMGRAPFAQFFCVMPLTLYVARTVCGYELASGLFQGNPNRAFVEQRIITDMGSRCIRCAGMRGYMRHGDLSLAVQVGDRFLPWDPEYHARLSEVVELGLGPGGIVVFSVTFTHNKLAFDVTTPSSDPIGLGSHVTSHGR